MQKLKQTKN